MKFRFNPAHRLIVVEAEIVGPMTSQIVRLGLDTGARRTVIDPSALKSVGYNLSIFPANSTATTAAGVINVRRLPVTRLTALGRSLSNLIVLAHPLPPSVNVDGLLGLDFFNAQILTIDFQRNEITLDPGTLASVNP